MSECEHLMHRSYGCLEKIRNKDFDIYFRNFLTLTYSPILRAALLYADPKYRGVQAPRYAVLPKPSKLRGSARVHRAGEKDRQQGKNFSKNPLWGTLLLRASRGRRVFIIGPQGVAALISKIK